MAFYRGQDGSATLDGTAVGQVVDWGINTQQAILDGTTMGDDWEVAVGGVGSFTLQMTVKFDGANAGQVEATSRMFLAAPTGASMTFQLLADTGKVFSGSGIVTGIEITHRINDLLVANFSLKGTANPATAWA